jgi:hypothetical protein
VVPPTNSGAEPNFPQDHTGPAIVEATMEGAARD